MVTAIIQPTKLRAVQEALAKAGVERITICDAQGFGRQRGQLPMYRGVEYQTNLLRKVMLQIAVNDDFLERTIDTIQRVARTGDEGNIGDGKIFVMPLHEVIQISPEQRGKGAV
jgi:nitrogen regulatory protein PII